MGFDLKKYFQKMPTILDNAKIIVESFADADAVDGEIIGTGRRDYTQSVTGYTLHYKGKDFVLYDVPGIEGNEKKFESIIQEAVNKSHLVFFITSDTKEVEPATADKIKKYLRNDSDVYSIINLHLPPKKNRDVEIDGTYQDELKQKFKNIETSSLKLNTDKTLSDKLGNNYKSGIIINGKEAFCACAFKDGRTTIIPDANDKTLREDQKKFLNEFSYDIDSMKRESHINDIEKIINSHSDGFEEFIIESNKKKFIARLRETHSKVVDLKVDATKKCDDFIAGYQGINNAAEGARIDFEKYISGNYIAESVQGIMDKILDEMYELIEKKKGDLNKSDCELFFEMREKRIEDGIVNALQDNFKEAVSRFENRIDEAVRRFNIDVENMRKFSDVNFTIPKPDLSGISDAMKYGWKDFFKKDLWSIGSFAAGGFFLGSAIPIIGNAVGAITGAFLGVIMSAVSWFMGSKRRIAKAKSKAREQFDKAENEIINNLEKEFQSSTYIQKMQECTTMIQEYCSTEIHKFEIIGTKMENLVKDLDAKVNKLKNTDYGKL